MLFTQKWYSQNNLVLHLGSSSLSWVCIPLSTWLMDEDKGEYINNDNEWSIIRWMEKWSNWTELMAHGRGAVEIKGMCIIELSIEGEVGGGIQWKAKMLMHLMQFGLSPIYLLSPYTLQVPIQNHPHPPQFLYSSIPGFLSFNHIRGEGVWLWVWVWTWLWPKSESTNVPHYESMIEPWTVYKMGSDIQQFLTHLYPTNPPKIKTPPPLKVTLRT